MLKSKVTNYMTAGTSGHRPSTPMFRLVDPDFLFDPKYVTGSIFYHYRDVMREF